MTIPHHPQAPTDIPGGVHRYGRTEQLVYGRPFAAEVLRACEQADCRRVAVFSTGSLKSTLARDLGAVLGERLGCTFASFAEHTPIARVLEAAQLARDARVDAIVALGGGSVVDGSKAVLMALAAQATTEHALLAFRGRIDAREVPRLMAVPTTLSGAEFTAVAGVTGANGRKQPLRDPLLAPRLVVLDPRASLCTPTHLWLSTGMRAVDHAVETVCSPSCDALSEAAALRGLELLVEGLRGVADAPGDVRARNACQLGLWLACVGPAAGVPMGVSHGIGHILGAEYSLPHGITSCVLMGAALRWNRPATLERQRRLERHLDLPGAEAADRIDFLLRELGLPHCLRDVGIGADTFHAIAERSLTDFFIPTNPRPVRSAADLLEVLRLAA